MSYEYDLLEVFGQVPPDKVGYARAYRRRRTWALDAVERVARPGDAILDVAAAQGNFSLALAERGFEVTWNDLREELAGYVRLKHTSGDIEYLAGDVFELSDDRQFDLVLATEIIEHVAHPDEFLVRLAGLVKSGGHVVLTTPNGAYLRNDLPKFSDYETPSDFEAVQFRPDGHIFLMYPEELSQLAERAGLRVRESDLIGTFLTAGWLGTAAVARRLREPTVSRLERGLGRLPNGIRRLAFVGIGALLAKP